MIGIGAEDRASLGGQGLRNGFDVGFDPASHLDAGVVALTVWRGRSRARRHVGGCAGDQIERGLCRVQGLGIAEVGMDQTCTPKQRVAFDIAPGELEGERLRLDADELGKRQAVRDHEQDGGDAAAEVEHAFGLRESRDGLGRRQDVVDGITVPGAALP